jgi:hypothetical protein
MAAWTKSAGFRDLVAATAAVLAIGSGGLIALTLWGSRADLPAIQATWLLAVALFAWSLFLVVSIAVATAGYEMAWPFAPSALMGLAASNLLLGVQVFRLGVVHDLFLLALPFLVVPPLVWLSHVIREMRRRCMFCEGSWRTRLHLVAGGDLTVCDLCVKAAAATEPPALDATIPRVTCGCCAAHLPGNQFPLRRDPAAMCRSCIELAHQVIAEGVSQPS